MSSQTRTFEPSEAFKAQLQKRIDDNLNQLLLDAKKSYDDKLSSLPSLSLPPHSSSNPRRPLSPSPMDAANDDAGASDLLYRRKLYYDYLQSVQELKNFARDEYKNAIERERQEMEWCVEAQASVAQAQGLRMVALEEGYGYHGGEEGFKVDEREKQEQFEMIEAFHEEMKRAEAKARLIEQSSDEEYSSSDEEEDYGNISFRPHPVLVELSEIEEVSEVEDDDSEFSGPGTPIVHPQPLDASLKAHAEELSRLLSATPSPPASPSLSTPSPLPGTPSPPDTPPSLTASASASDCELDTDEGETAPSSVASSIIFNPKDETGGLIFTPHRSVIDEEIRVRAERHAKQQEAFAQRAEEIRRKKEEDKKASRVNEMLVSLVSDSKDEPQDQSKALVVVDKTKGKGKLPATPFNSPAISRSNTTTTVARYGAAPPGSQYYRAQTPSVSLALAASRALATPAPKAATAAAPTTPTKPLKQKTSVALFSSPSYAQQPGYKAVPRTFVNPTGFSVSPEDVLRILSSHEAQWQKLLSSSPSSAISSSTNGGGALKWTDFPWPVLSFTPPKSSGELSKDGVAAYVYSSLEASSLAEYDDYNGLGDPLLSHSSPSSRASSRAASPFGFNSSSSSESPREKHRRREKLEALVGRWSGYGFERVLYRVGVSGGERERVRYGAGLVCRWVREMGEDLGW